jgi:hypothetical protein
VPYATFDGDRMTIDYSQPQRSYDDYHKKPWYWLRTHSALYRARGRFLVAPAAPGGGSGEA